MKFEHVPEKIKMVVDVPEKFVLELDKEEAKLIYVLTGNIIGTHPIRKSFTDELYNKLHDKLGSLIECTNEFGLDYHSFTIPLR